MKRQSALLLISDVFFSFLIFSFSPGSDASQRAMLVFSCLLLAVCLIAQHCRRVFPRFLLSLLPGLGLLLAPIDNLFLLLALVWGYSMLVISAGDLVERLRMLRAFLAWFFLVWVLLLILNVIYYGGLGTSSRSISADSSLALSDLSGSGALLSGADLLLSQYSYRLLFHLFFYFFTAVYTRRLYLMQAAMPRSWHLYNALSVGALSLGALVVSGLTVALFKSIRPLGSWLFSGVGKLLLLLFGKGSLQTETESEPSAEPIQDLSDYLHGTSLEEDVKQELLASSPQHPIVVKEIWFCLLAALLLCLLLFLLIRRLRRRGPASEQEMLIYEETEPLFGERQRRRERAYAGSGERQALRRIYRRYLIFLRKRGLTIRKSSTSHEILTDSRAFSSAEASVRLRRLYLKARYAILTPISHEDVQEAARCLKLITHEEAPNSAPMEKAK